MLINIPFCFSQPEQVVVKERNCLQVEHVKKQDTAKSQSIPLSNFSCAISFALKVRNKSFLFFMCLDFRISAEYPDSSFSFFFHG